MKIKSICMYTALFIFVSVSFFVVPHILNILTEDVHELEEEVDTLREEMR